MLIGIWNLENLFRPGGGFGPVDQTAYDSKLDALAVTIHASGVDVLGLVTRTRAPGHEADSDDLDDYEAWCRPAADNPRRTPVDTAGQRWAIRAGDNPLEMLVPLADLRGVESR